MNITEKDLTLAFEKYKDAYVGVKNDYFAPLFLMRKFEKSFEQAAECCAFGNNDYGFDAYYCDPAACTLHLFQFKWSSNYELFHDSYRRIIDKGFEYIFKNTCQDPNQNNFIKKLKLSTSENRNIIKDVFFYFVFNGEDDDLDKAERSKRLENDREELENKNYYLKSYFNDRDVRLTIVYVANKTKSVSSPKTPQKIHEYKVQLSDQISFSHNGAQMNVGFISLWDLYQMHKEMGHRFFDKNIRAGLSTDTAPNKSIRSSLKSIIIDEKESPETFTFNHNGVTIAVEDLIIDGNNSATMVEPRILNGAQTVTNFKHFYEATYKDHPAIDKNSDKIKTIKLLAKIINAQDKSFITNITICNNKQNPVEPWNLHANDDIQVALEDMFKFKINNSMGIGYERLENYYTNMSDDDLEDEGVQGGKKIGILTLAKTFLAVQGEVDKMSRISDVFESEKEYNSTFRTSYLDGKPQKIVLGYKIVYRLGAIIRKINKKADSYYYVTRARNLVWALLIQGVLNHAELDELCDTYGNDLYQAANYYNVLNDIATKKIIKIMQHAVNSDQKYKDFLKDEKYTFLRTKSFYDLCMNHAKNELGWQKKSF